MVDCIGSFSAFNNMKLYPVIKKQFVFRIKHYIHLVIFCLCYYIIETQKKSMLFLFFTFIFSNGCVIMYLKGCDSNGICVVAMQCPVCRF